MGGVKYKHRGLKPGSKFPAVFTIAEACRRFKVEKPLGSLGSTYNFITFQPCQYVSQFWRNDS